MKLDPRTMADWQIAEAAEEHMKSLKQLADELGLADGEMLPFGTQLAKLDYFKILERVKGNSLGKYIDVTAITPTPLAKAEQQPSALSRVSRLGKRYWCNSPAQRWPTFNIKGSAAGSGRNAFP